MPNTIDNKQYFAEVMGQLKDVLELDSHIIQSNHVGDGVWQLEGGLGGEHEYEERREMSTLELINGGNHVLGLMYREDNDGYWKRAKGYQMLIDVKSFGLAQAVKHVTDDFHGYALDEESLPEAVARELPKHTATALLSDAAEAELSTFRKSAELSVQKAKKYAGLPDVHRFISTAVLSWGGKEQETVKVSGPSKELSIQRANLILLTAKNAGVSLDLAYGSRCTTPEWNASLAAKSSRNDSANVL